MEFRIKAAIILLAVLSGCVSAPIHSGFLADYDNLKPQYSLDGVRLAESLNLSSYDTLVMTPTETKLIGSEISEEDKKSIVDNLNKNFRTEMSRYFKNVVTDSNLAGTSQALKLELTITELEPTDVAKNLIVGFGAGNATASIEGRFSDASSGQELIAFMDRKKGSPFTKKEFNAGTKFPNWSKLEYLYLFTEIWPENVGKIIKDHKP